jgi:hypothetical protein
MLFVGYGPLYDPLWGMYDLLCRMYDPLWRIRRLAYGGLLYSREKQVRTKSKIAIRNFLAIATQIP